MGKERCANFERGKAKGKAVICLVLSKVYNVGLDNFDGLGILSTRVKRLWSRLRKAYHTYMRADT